MADEDDNAKTSDRTMCLPDYKEKLGVCIKSKVLEDKDRLINYYRTLPNQDVWEKTIDAQFTTKERLIPLILSKIPGTEEINFDAQGKGGPNYIQVLAQDKKYVLDGDRPNILEVQNPKKKFTWLINGQPDKNTDYYASQFSDEEARYWRWGTK